MISAPHATAQLTLSDLSDISLGDYNDSVLELDIDGDSVTDFNISVFNTFSSGLNSLGTNASAENLGSLQVFELGDSINSGWDFNSYSTFNDFVSGGTQYVGVQFDISGNTHFGWLEFNFLNTEFIDGTLVSAGWQATPGATATISALSAVPEPASAGLWSGIAASMVGFWRRRRRTS
ncbi:hypothetical protein [Synoicihabitans lomoniglobus]|nr:hypothetical protein [Opitutaceae bacterium LMO-M01]